MEGLWNKAKDQSLANRTISYVYGWGAQRQWFRQTCVHQTLTLDGKDSAYRPKLLLWQPGTDLDALAVENGSYPSLTHRRAVFFVKKRFFVFVDEALGSAGGNVDLHFQFAPGEAVYMRPHPAARTSFGSVPQ